jgi:mannobiose 2-epimerase
MMQVRMIHALSAAHRFGATDNDYLDLADQGFSYLIDTFWDKKNGGFYFSVTREGAPLLPRKNTDFHAYALTGIAEYYRASKNEEALLWASRIFDLLQEKAVDPGKGFVEDFDDRTWPVLNSEQMNLGGQQTIKTIDMHTNVLEGFLFLAHASGDIRHKRAVRDILDLICEKGISDHGCTITAFNADWQPVRDSSGRMTTSYGLNVELAWLIWEATAMLGGSTEPYHAVARGLVDHALNYGFDWERGGLAANGPDTGSILNAEALGPDRLFKPWWAQAELLNALCYVCSSFDERRYFDALVKTFDWIYQFQIDHEYGDWYSDVDWETGKPLTTDKGGEFKTAFHAGRALIRLINFLRTWRYPPEL